MTFIGHAFRLIIVASLAGLAGAYLNENIISRREWRAPPAADPPIALKPALVAQMPASASAPYLDIPAEVERPNAMLVKPYKALRAGLMLRYSKNLFSTHQPELMWVPEIETGTGRVLLHWQTSENGKPGLLGLFDGNLVETVDDKLYDFGVGSLFVKLKRNDGVVGYGLYETLIGEMEPADDSLWSARELERVKANTTIVFDGITLYEKYISRGPPQIEQEILKLIQVEAYATSLSGGTKGGVHPLLAGSTVYGLLMTSLHAEVTEELRAKAVAASEIFFREYVFPKQVEIAPGIISWPFNIEWVMNWGIKLSPPWYSAYANSQFIAAAAILHKLTGKPEYREFAIKAAKILDVPLERGGSEYTIDGFRFPAEYIYQTPPIPNVRVIDGEFGTAIAVYNAARLLGDSHLLKISARHFASLATQIPLFTQPNGSIMFSMYVADMPPHYQWMIWTLLQASANIMKDRTFLEAAKRMRSAIPEKWCADNGC